MSLEAGIRMVDSFSAQLRGISVPLLGALAYAVFLGATFEASSSLILRLISQALALGVILVWAIRVWRGSADMPRTPLDVGLGLLLLAHLVSTATSVDPRLSLESSLYVILFVLLFYFLVDRVRVSWTPERVAGTLILLSQVVVVATLLELVVWRWGIFADLGWTETIRGLSFYRGRLVLGHANPLGWFLGMMFPLWLGAVRVGPSRPARLHGVLWLGLLTVAELSTFSRGGWIVAGAAAGIWALVQVAQSPMARTRFAALWRRALSRWVVVSLLILLLVSLALGTGWLVTRIRPDSASFRLQLWSLALQLVAEGPLTGSGPGTYAIAIWSLNLPPPPGSEVSTHAHNGYLNLAAETGLLGLAALFVLAVQLGRALWVGLQWSEPDGLEDSPRGSAFTLFFPALAGLLAANLFDTTSHFPYMTLLLVLVAAVLLAPHSGPRKLTARLAVRLAPMAVSLFLLGSFLWLDLAELFQTRGIQAAGAGDLAAARQELARASALDPALRVYPFQRGVVNAEEFFETGDRRALDEAVRVFEEQVSSGLRLRLVQSDLAWLRWYAGDPDGAAAALHDASQRTPWDARLWMGLGFVAERSGDLSAAREAYAMALALEPGLARSAYWNVSAFFAEREALLHRAIGVVRGIPRLPEHQVPSRQAHLAFYAGDEARARSLIVSAPVTMEGLLVEGLLALEAGDLTAADKAASQALSLGGAGGGAYLVRGLSLAAQGATELGRRDFLVAARFGHPEGHAFIGEILYDQGRYAEAIQAYEAGLRPPCPVPPLIYAFDSNVYHRADYLLDFTPEVLRCAPRDDLHSLYLHLADAYLKVGRSEEAQELLAWLGTYDRPA